MKQRKLDVFQKLLMRAAREGVFPVLDRKAREWFRKRAYDIDGITPDKVIKEKPEAYTTPKPGDCFIFRYDAKWKKKLPYWDQYPVIILLDVWEKEKKLLGINLHYLPYGYRALLLDAIYSLLTNTDEGFRLKITYRILKRFAKYKAFYPCVKQYHIHLIKTRMAKVKIEEMDIGMFLPIARWKKQSQEVVWRESAAKIKGWDQKRKAAKRKKKS